MNKKIMWILMVALFILPMMNLPVCAGELTEDAGPVLTDDDPEPAVALDLDQVVDDEGELEPDGEPYYFNYGNIDTSGLAEGECYCKGCQGDTTGDLVIPSTITDEHNHKVYTVVGVEGFSGKTGFTSVKFPEGLRVIKSGAFSNCTGLTGDLNIPDSVTEIETDAFYGCTGLTGKLKLPSNLAKIGDRVFQNCAFTGTLDLPKGLKEIGSSAFNGCSGFTGTLVIPESVNSLRGSAFKGCTGFKNTLTIPAALSVVGSEAFNGCTGFTGLVISKGVTTINSEAFLNCTGMTGTLVLPDTLTKINYGAFKNCSFTGDLTIPEGITSVADETFACPGIDGTLTIPQSVTTVDTWTFSGMLKVKRIINNSDKRLLLVPNFIDRNDKETFFLNTATQEKVYAINENDEINELPKGTFLRNGEYKIAVTGVSLDRTTAEVNVDSTITLVPTVIPADATDKSVTWKSNNEAIATVTSGGVVKGVSAGTAVITVTTVDGNKTATCTVTVKDNKPAVIKVEGISLDKTSAELKIGGTVTLTPTVTPSNATDKSVTWKSSNNGIATVTAGGVVKGVSAGTANITVTTTDGGKAATCSVTVRSDDPEVIKVTGVSIKKSATIIKGKKLTLKATITPADATNKQVAWKSSKTTVATVSKNGVVKAKKAGKATITVTTVDGNKTAKCKITVKNPIKVRKISLNKKKATIKKGETLKLKVKIKPSDATNKEVTWKSSNKKVATVDKNGKVKGKKKGTATITATARDGSKKNAKCKITVK